MNAARRSTLAGGIVLILLGILFLTAQLFPDMWSWIGPDNWPLIVIGVGALLLIIGAVAGAPEMAVPAFIVAAVGGLLYWQIATGNWASWAYAWPLIPAAAGLGAIVTGLWKRQWSKVRSGASLLVIMLIVFAILAAVFGTWFDRPVILQRYWPVLLILLGLIVMVDYFVRARRSDSA